MNGTCPAHSPIRRGDTLVACHLAPGHGPSHEGIDTEGAYHHWYLDLTSTAWLTVAHYPPNIALSLLETRRGL